MAWDIHTSIMCVQCLFTIGHSSCLSFSSISRILCFWKSETQQVTETVKEAKASRSVTHTDPLLYLQKAVACWVSVFLKVSDSSTNRPSGKWGGEGIAWAPVQCQIGSARSSCLSVSSKTKFMWKRIKLCLYSSANRVAFQPPREINNVH